MLVIEASPSACHRAGTTRRPLGQGPLDGRPHALRWEALDWGLRRGWGWGILFERVLVDRLYTRCRSLLASCGCACA
ncbi:hypothetical protein A5690_14450 [Mycobacterium intracellulare]|nr:hypothetical protein A5690_14450 [Mycobacterium intracellulare]